MSRRKAAPVRLVLPDPLFKSEMLAKFINVMMRGGKKSVAERIIYDALNQVLRATLQRMRRQEGSGDAGREDGGDSGGGSAGLLMKLTLEEADIRKSAASRQAVMQVFKEALDQITPTVEVRSRRVGGSTYQVPMEIRGKRRIALAMRWLVQYANARHEKTMVLRLTGEIMDALAGRGNAVKKREDMHRMAKANQAFAHYRW